MEFAWIKHTMRFLIEQDTDIYMNLILIRKGKCGIGMLIKLV